MKLRILAAALAGFLAAAPLPAAAQIQPIYTSQVWLPQSKLSPAISVTTSSAATLLPVIAGQVLPGNIGWFCNTGSNDAYLAFGTANTVAATVAGGSWLKAATCAAYPLNIRPGVTYTYVAALTGSSTTTIAVETGLGTPPLSIASSGGGSGGGTSSAFGATFPTTGTAVGFTDGTNMQPGKVDASGNVYVNPVGVVDPTTYTSQTGSPIMARAETAPTAISTAQLGFASMDVLRNLRVAPQPTTAGGLSKSYATLANSTNATVVKNGLGQVYNVVVSNNSANIAYLKFYNKATTPTCNSDTVVDKILIPGNASGVTGSVTTALGDTYTTGISYCVTGLISDTDNTAVAASAFTVTVKYK